MGYNTRFSGKIGIEPPLLAEHRADVLKVCRKEWCYFEPTEDGASLRHTGMEKTDAANIYFAVHRLGELGYTLNGTIDWQGEEIGDLGRIHVKDSKVRLVKAEIVHPEPAWD